MYEYSKFMIVQYVFKYQVCYMQLLTKPPLDKVVCSCEPAYSPLLYVHNL